MANTTESAEFEERANSREIRVFLSSTFRDFNEERKLLATQVFPDLNRRARERGVELVEVDLRWGITQEEAEDGHALEICLQEIENCKPYFIGMLGDSYGSITPPQRQILQASPELLSRRKWLDGRFGEASYTELEIEHSIELLKYQNLEGQALFYFRNPTYSTMKASKGEEGWSSTDPGDRQRLEALKSKIRGSGHHYVEDLDGPEEIASRIEHDLWQLIDKKFPAEDSPNESEKETLRHKAYGDDRRKLYLGGNKMLGKLEKAIEDNQGLILVTGESGFGKSSLVANWEELHTRAAPSDVVFCHHLGCGNEASEVLNLMKRYLLFLHQSLRDHGIKANDDIEVMPCEWWRLVSLVNQNLVRLSQVAVAKGFRIIWILDSLDRLPEESQSSLPWIPSSIPPNIHIVVASLPCNALAILLERKYRRIRIEELALAEKENVIDLHLKRYSRSLDRRLREKILGHYLSHSPLFLRVILEELRKTAGFDFLEHELDRFLSAESVPEIYERILIRLENDFSINAVQSFLTTIWASRTGLSETDLLEITRIAPLKLFGIRLSLGDSLINSSGRLVFAHDYVKSAVEFRYLRTERDQLAAHEAIFNWQSARPYWDSRKFEELPWQAMKAGKTDEFKSLFLEPDILNRFIESWGVDGVYRLLTSFMPTSYHEIACQISETSLKQLDSFKGTDISQCTRTADAISDFLEYAGFHNKHYLRLRQVAFRLTGRGTSNIKGNRQRSFERLLDAYYWTGRYRSYRRGAKLVYERYCRSAGEASDSSIIALVSLVNAQYLCHNYIAVSDMVARYLKLAKDVLGEVHPSFLLLVCIYGRMSFDLGEYPRAIGLLCYATEGFYACYGPQHWQTVNALHHLGVAIDAAKPSYEELGASLQINRTCIALLKKTYRDDHPFLSNIRRGDSLEHNKLPLHEKNPISNLMTFQFNAGQGMIGAITKRYNSYLRFKAPKADWVLFEAYSQEAVSAAEQGNSKKAFALLYRKLHAAFNQLSTERPLRPIEALESLGLKISTNLCKISSLGAITGIVDVPILSRSHRAAYQLLIIFGNLTSSGLSFDFADLHSALQCRFVENGGYWSGAYNGLVPDIFHTYHDMYVDEAQRIQIFGHDYYNWLITLSLRDDIRDILELCSILLTHRLLKLPPDNFLVAQALTLSALANERAGNHDASIALFRQLVIHRVRYSNDLEWAIEAAKRELLRVNMLREGLDNEGLTPTVAYKFEAG